MNVERRSRKFERNGNLLCANWSALSVSDSLVHSMVSLSAFRARLRLDTKSNIDPANRTEMGRLGEVRVGMDEDYDKWGIEIMCSFRETEKIKQLSATRQSGGVSLAPSPLLPYFGCVPAAIAVADTRHRRRNELWRR